MKWEDFQSSQNVEDRRGGDQYADAGAGSGLGAGHLGLGTVVVLGLIGYMTGINPAVLIGGAEMLNGMRGGQTAAPHQARRASGPPADQMGQFVSKILGENEEVWSQVLPAQKHIQFQPPRLVMFDGQTESGCGAAESAMGPFYCPMDHKIYLDTSFFRDMKSRFGGGGDFAYAYVISHEMGHHIQNQLGISAKGPRRPGAGRQPGAGQRAFGSHRANGRLPRRRLGRQRQRQAAVSGAGRRRKGGRHRPGHWRRPVAEGLARGCRAGFLHAWLVGAARAMAEAGQESGQIDSCNTFSGQ